MRAAVLMLVAIGLVGCSKKTNTDAAMLERNFQTMLTGATLVGYSTFDRKEGMSGEERYAIDGATKIGSETWLLRARMKLHGREFPVPVPVTIKWAGDTPVLTLTDASIPGFGSYTVRLVFYNDRYAGTWSGKGFGGQMFGKIVHGPVQ